jgi:hypothetical protein
MQPDHGSVWRYHGAQTRYLRSYNPPTLVSTASCSSIEPQDITDS